MPRRPEIGNVQLYPNRPLQVSDRNGYVLKFYCPIRRKRIRRNCGTRDRREARRILRECQERLLNGTYVASGGAITSEEQSHDPLPKATAGSSAMGWQEACERYRLHKQVRVRKKSLDDALSRINIAERIFEGYRQDRGLPEGLAVSDAMTLDQLEYLQDRLLAGDECRYDQRSPNTVNSMMAAVMAFVRFCQKHGWINAVPPVEKLDTDDVMKGRPITGEEFDRMIEATSAVVGTLSAPSWQFALRILWESGFRVGDLMDFSWEDERHIHPVWATRRDMHSTIIVPSTQKNGRHQEIPMQPGLQALLEAVPEKDRTGWIANPLPIEYEIKSKDNWFRPTDKDLKRLVETYSNCSIAAACGVSETAVRKWLVGMGIRRSQEFQVNTGSLPESLIEELRSRTAIRSTRAASRSIERLTKERVGRIIALIGETAGVIVIQPDKRTNRKKKYASAHDLRRGCAQRLINAGVSAETLKVLMRHSNFATTERHYGAMRSAQAAAEELVAKLREKTSPDAFVGGLMGGQNSEISLSPSEIKKLKALLNSL